VPNKRNLLTVVCLVFTAIVLLLPGCSNGQAATPLSSTTSTPLATPFTASQVPTSRPATTSPPATITTSPSKQSPVASGAEVNVVSSSQTVKPGDKFDIFIKINSNKPTRGFQCTLNWDAAKTECSSVELGDYYQGYVKDHKGDLITLPNPLKADNSIGQFPEGVDPVYKTAKSAAIAVAGAIGSDGVPLGPVGVGDSFVLHMTAKAGVSGSARFALSNVVVKDNAKPANSLEVKVTDVQVTISPN
jgi:hypothetical protein